MSILNGFKTFERYLKIPSGYQLCSERQLAKDVLMGDGNDENNNVENSLTQLSNPNLLINGDFQVWQRGTDFPVKTGQYTADRCFNHANNTYAIQVSKVSDGLRMTSLLSGCVNVIYSYHMEDLDLKGVRGETVTLTYSIDGVVHSFTRHNFGRIYVQDDVVMEDFSIENGNADLDNEVIRIQYSNSISGTSKTLNWVKLEKGSIATPFVPRTYAEELMLCQRYYQNFNPSNSVDELCFVASWIEDTWLCGGFLLPVEMRIQPTVIVSSVYLYGNDAWIGISPSNFNFTDGSGHNTRKSFWAFYGKGDISSNAGKTNILKMILSLDAEIY